MQGMEFGDLKRPMPEGPEAVLSHPLEMADPTARPSKKRASNPAAANQRHIKTEQARRDKIAAGFTALQELLPGRDRVEKAAVLNQAAEYIARMQACLAEILANGTIAKLPDELQWQIRQLLPRKDPAAPRLPQLGQPGGMQLPGPGMVAMQGDGQQGDPNQPQVSPVNLSFLPLLTQGSAQGPNAQQMTSKEMSKDEGALMAQVQAQLSQIQQQAQAAQQLQTWQQAIHALQLQSVLNNQQPGAGPADLQALASLVSMAPPTSGPAMFKQPSGEPAMNPASLPGLTNAQPPQHDTMPNETFTELLTPKPEPHVPAPEEVPQETELQEETEAAPASPHPSIAPTSQSKSRKSASKVKRSSSATKSQKADSSTE